MADKEIKDYGEVVTPALTDLYVCQQSGVTKKITTSQQLATNDETIAGTVDNKVITPANLTAKIDTDDTLSGNSDLRIPSQKAVKTYAGDRTINRGRVWVSHGNNVITFEDVHPTTNYRWLASLSTEAMGGITPRNTAHTRGLSLFVSNDTTTRGKVRIEGGYGFTSCGFTTAHVGTTERFDDVANTHTARADATARYLTSGFSLNGYGFISCGYNDVDNLGTTERFDDIANAHTARTDATARRNPAGYSLNGYGFTSCGYITTQVGTTERFDDVANTHTARADATARFDLKGYSLNGYGFTSCGFTTACVGTTERFDDVANTHTARTDATARRGLTGYSLNGYGFTSCGYISTYVGITERFDDVVNTHTTRADADPRQYTAGYSLNGYGFTSCGYTLTTNLGITERFDDITNTHTTRTDATARRGLAGYATNEYFINYMTFNE